MDKGEKLFNKLVDQFTSEYENVTFGKMMSSPAIKYNGKVFAFFYNGQMTYKLGEEFNPASMGLTNVDILNPFKRKGPLKGWFVVGYNDNKKWEELTNLALSKISGK